MQQKLSALNYIKNNKRRTGVLIISLGLCFVLTYITQFLLSTTEITNRSIAVENTQKIQYISLAQSSFGIDIENLSDEEIGVQYEEKNLALAKQLKNYKGVKDVWYASVFYPIVSPAIGEMAVEVPLLPKEHLQTVLSQMNAKIAEGRLPENSGEIVLDEKIMKNNNWKIGNYAQEENIGKRCKIVGILDCKYYFGCGIPTEDYIWGKQLVIISDGIQDFSRILKKEGIEVRETYDTVVDYKWGEKFLKEEVTDVIAESTTYIYVGIIVLLTISLLVVYTTYLRDRHNEWCLYCSIGFSRKEIYFAIFRELLFTFGMALLVGGVWIVALVMLLNYMMVEPQGIMCQFFHPKTLVEILCTYVLMIGILHIPIRYALYRIRTIDAMDDDL